MKWDLFMCLLLLASKGCVVPNDNVKLLKKYYGNCTTSFERKNKLDNSIRKNLPLGKKEGFRST
jgi:hypothetical protein